MCVRLIGAILFLMLATPCHLQLTVTAGRISTDEFRLFGGTNPSEGRLQIKHADLPEGSWATVCSDDVDAIVAFALCARLGHKLACDYGQAAELDTTSTPSADLGPIENVNFVDCVADRVPYELDCNLIGFSDSACPHSQDIWLRCASNPGDLELRLADNPMSPYAGTLEARCRDSPEWSAVCSSYSWDYSRDAEVACRHLGFSFAIETKDIYVSSPGSRVIISELGCHGNETDLMECQIGLVSSSCSKVPKISCGSETSEYGSQVGLCGIDDLCGPECIQEPSGEPRTGCHCDDVCASLNDCCYDYQINCNPVGLDPSTSLNGIPVDWFKCVELPSLSGYFLGYYLISVCPVSWLDSGVRVLCETPSMNQLDIIGSLPVYNNDNVRQYRNIYCAICNGEPYERMITWAVRAAYSRSSGSESNVPNFNVTLPGVFTGSYTVQVPDSLRDQVRRCSAPTVDSCLDEFSGSDTERGCLSYPGPAAHRTFIGGALTNYRNPYCAKCNNVTLTLRESCGYFLCSESCDVTDPWSRCFESCEGVGNTLTLDLLFSFGTEGAVPGNVISCKTGEIFDPFLGSCRALTCATGFEIQGTMCIEKTVPPTSKPNVTGQAFAYSPNNTVSVGLADCLRLFLGETTQGIVYWDATLTGSSSYESFLTVNLLAGNETVVDNIQSALNSLHNSSVCNISQVVLFLEVQNILPADICKIYNLSGLEFGVYVTNSNVFRIRQFDYDYFMKVYNISGIDNACLHYNLACSSFVTLNSTEFVQSRVGNETVLEYVPSQLTIPQDAHVVLTDGTAVVCADYITGTQPPKTATDLALTYLSVILYSLSVIALAVTFIVYCMLPPLRNLAGLCIMSLVVALFTANLLLLLSGFFLDVPTLCLIVAPIIHFTWLAAFTWMAVLSFNVAKTLSSKVVNKQHAPTTKPLLQYMLFAWGVPLVIVSICLALHFCQCTSASPIYVDQTRCYIVNPLVNLYAFGIPVALTLVLNICLFVYTVVFIRRSRSASRMARNETRLQEAKVEFVIYVRLCVLMGLCWILGFLTQVIGGYVIIFIFVILNSLQGVMICLSFCVTKRVRKLLAERYGYFKRRHPTTRNKTNRYGASDTSGTQNQTNASLNTDTTNI